MPARILAPLTGDTVTIALGGTVVVSASYGYSPIGSLQCFVEPDSDAAAALMGKGIHNGNVTSSRGAGTHNNVPVRIETGGIEDMAQSITLVVTGGSYVVTAQRIDPLPPIPFPPYGVPVKFNVFGTAEPGAAYVLLVAHAVPPPPGPHVPVDGVFMIPDATNSWAGQVVIPNLPNWDYIARIIQFDAADNIIRKNTVVLR